MSKVSLREYIRDINSLIEENHIREAKEHCAYILKSYPKYIDVYRLLGKAHLESRRYDEAEKIFVRVLAVLPDDFISHLGMSVVKEEQENLDAAIWHMERAYELKSTQTIHEELHRLFTMRDGVAPPKPLITRGALIRINVRSGLFQQALKEIDLALKEDPQRLDLEILRAQIYYSQKNIPLAVRYCKVILQKRPYAYDANLLMTEIASTQEQAEPFKQRMFELDPYTSLVDDSTSLEEVPADAIMIEKLDLAMQAPKEDTPIVEEIREEPVIQTAQDPLEVPEEISQEITPSTDMADSTILEANANENAQIPDWMQEMGWEAGSSRTSDEEQAMIAQYDQVVSNETDEGQSEAVIETDIPDWLKDLQPIEEEEPVVEIENNQEDEEEKIAWLNDILPDEGGNVSSNPTSVTPEQKSPYSSVPEFGEDLDADQEWLEKISSSEPHLLDPSEQSTDRPSRMPEPEDVMDFSYDDTEDEMDNIPQSQPPADDSGGEDIDSAIAWLEGLAAKQGAEEEVLFSDLDAREEKPDWLDQQAEEEVSEIEEPSYVIEDEFPEIPTDEFEEEEFEDMFGTVEETPLVKAEQPPIGSPESFSEDELPSLDDADVPEWLKTIAPPESVEADEVVYEPPTTEQPISPEPELEIPEELDSLFDNTPMDEIDLSQETSGEDLVVPSEAMNGDTEVVPDSEDEQFATTAILDFIKKEVDDEIDEVDNWLKNLPQDESQKDTVESVEEVAALEKSVDELFTEEPAMAPPSLENLSDDTPADTEYDDRTVEFIDDYFTEEVDNTPKDETPADEETEPYQWEQEFENIPTEDSDLPDWIAGIEEEEEPVNEPTTSELVRAKAETIDEIIDNSADMPAWMKAETTEAQPVEEVAQSTEETIQFENVEEEIESIDQPEEFKDSWSDSQDEQESPVEESLPHEEPTVESIVEEIDENSRLDAEEVFLIAKNKLHNGDFSEAFPRLKELLEKDEWLEQVMEALIHDIEHYHPIEVESWVLLGDAYRKQDRLKEALDAYTKAEDFIK